MLHNLIKKKNKEIKMFLDVKNNFFIINLYSYIVMRYFILGQNKV